MSPAGVGRQDAGAPRRVTMTSRLMLILSLTIGAAALSGCAAAVGAGAAVGADAIAEEEGGNLF